MSDHDPLRPMPMSPEEIADLVERTRAAMCKSSHAQILSRARRSASVVPPTKCRRTYHAEYMRRWRAKKAAA